MGIIECIVRGRLHSLLLAAVLLLPALPSTSTACDFCSCLTGIDPFVLQGSHIELVTLIQQSTSPGLSTPGAAEKLLHGGGDGVGGTSDPIAEHRITSELSVRHGLTRRFELGVRVPFGRTDLEIGDRSLRIDAILDPVVSASMVFDDPFGWRNGRGRLGLGVSLPLAPDDLVDRSKRLDHDLQPGTGSVGLTAEGALSAGFEGWTAGLSIDGRLHTSNDRGDRRGHSVSINLASSIDLARSNPTAFALLGQFGTRLESSGEMIRRNVTIEGSGATSIWGRIGLELLKDRTRIRAGILHPISQHRAIGSADESTRFTVGVGFRMR